MACCKTVPARNKNIPEEKREYMADPSPSAFDQTSVVLPANAPPATNKISGRAIVSNRQFVVAWRILIIIASLTGIVMGSKSIVDFVAKLLYFTIQSNLILVVCIGYAALGNLAQFSWTIPSAQGCCYRLYFHHSTGL